MLVVNRTFLYSFLYLVFNHYANVSSKLTSLIIKTDFYCVYWHYFSIFQLIGHWELRVLYFTSSRITSVALRNYASVDAVLFYLHKNISVVQLQPQDLKYCSSFSQSINVFSMFIASFQPSHFVLFCLSNSALQNTFM